MRLTAVALALTLLGGFAVADGLAAPPAEAAGNTDPTPYFPDTSGLSVAADVTALNPCTYILQQKDAKAWPSDVADKAFANLNCNSVVISKNQMPQQLIAERKISDLVPNCSPDPIVNIGTSWSDVQYVENATTHSTSTSNGFTAGVTVTNGFKTGIFGFGSSSEISISASTTNTWSFGTDERVAIQTGKWRNGTTDMPIPGYSWAYYGYKDLYQQADVLWRWTPDPKRPNNVMSAVQTINVHEWVNGGFKNPGDTTGKQNQFGVPILHIVPMTPAEIRNCWDNGVPAGWKPGDPRLSYVPNMSKLSFPIVDEPLMRAPSGTMSLDTYPFLYSTYPQGNPVTRNLAVAPTTDRYASGTPAAKIPFQKTDTPAPVSMWGQFGNRTNTTESIVMPAGSEVGFWTGKACTRLTATIGGTAPKNREFEQRVKVFAVSMVGGQPQYDRELGDYLAPNPGSLAGMLAHGQISLDIPAGTEAIAIRAYRPDRESQDVSKMSNVLDGNRDAIVLSKPEITCAPETDKPGDDYIRSAYIGDVSDVVANLAATPAQVAADPYLNLRPNATPSEGYPCNARPDYVGYSCNGTPTRSEGLAYPKAIGLHSPSTVEWGLTSPTCSAFVFGVAFDDHMAGGGSRKPVSVEVYIDGVFKKTVQLAPYPDRNPVVKAEVAFPYGPHMIQLRIAPSGNDNSQSHVNIIEPGLKCKVQEPRTGTKPTPAKPVAMEYISVNDLTWSNEISWHWGKARRNINPVNEGPIEIGGLVFPVGIFAHSLSKFDVTIPRKDCSVFMADIGVVSTGNDASSIVFELWDGEKRLAQSRVMRAGETAAFIQANIIGVSRLTLKVTDGGDSVNMDHAGWGNPVIGCGGSAASTTTPPPAPEPPAPNPTPPSTPPGTTKDISALDVKWEENRFVYRPATRGTNLDDGKPVSYNNGTYPVKAIAAVSGSVIRIQTQGECTGFSATVGLDDYARRVSAGTLQFSLVGDGTTLVTSPVMNWTNGVVPLNANISGVRSLELRVTDAGDGINWDHGVWGYPTLTCRENAAVLTSLQPSTQYLADLPWRQDDWSDFPSQRNTNMSKTAPVSIRGTQFQHGIGAHSNSIIRIPISPSCTTFIADVGIDDSAGGNGYVQMQMWADSTMKWSGNISGSMAATHLEIPISGTREIALTTLREGDPSWDHVAWGDPRVTCIE